MELVKVYLDLNSKSENNMFLSMHLSVDSHRNQGIRTWHRPAPPTYVMGSTMPVGFSRNTENHESDSRRIPGFGTRYEDQRSNETKEEYKIRKKKESIRFNVQIGIGICFLTLAVLTKLAVTIFSALW
ncbi:MULTISPECIES: hypothetical protein [Bacillus cereus group]|uniref:hypothetical protein n=1 Tax=Bacillus cereus group TaxID=86661 RepID=UPI0018F38D61|nr:MULTISPECIES: hypothetical protein [Bacillus cereus group]MBJ7935608.1 hypothetical protein [Bacillus cereus]